MTLDSECLGDYIDAMQIMYLTVVTWIQCRWTKIKAEETPEREFFDVFLEQATLTLTTSNTGSLYRSHNLGILGILAATPVAKTQPQATGQCPTR